MSNDFPDFMVDYEEHEERKEYLRLTDKFSSFLSVKFSMTELYELGGLNELQLLNRTVAHMWMSTDCPYEKGAYNKVIKEIEFAINRLYKPRKEAKNES